MKSRHIFLIGIMALLLLFGCITQTEQTGDKLIVGVTIAPQAEFVEKIGGDKVDVVLMVPPGASPHTYEPTPQQLEKISNAKAYVKVGSGVEFELSWMDNLISLNKNMLVVDSSKGINLIDMSVPDEHGESGMDPHIWTSPKNAKIMVENIYQGLVQVDPENQAYYEQNKNAYLEELNVVDGKIQSALEGKKNRKFIVYHPAWGYFARDYGLEQIAIEEEGKEPTSQGIEAVIKQAKENNITIIFASPEFSTSNAETIANEIGGKVILISPLEKNYAKNIMQVADAFEESMN